MTRDPIRIRLDAGTPPLDIPAIMEIDSGEEVMLAAIDPGGGHQQSGSEMTFPLPWVPRPRQLIDDEVDDILGDVHRVVGGSDKPESLSSVPLIGIQGLRESPFDG